MAEERIQKILARAGYGSRRASETLIADGRVRVNGNPVVLGAKADPEKDQITVDGQPIPNVAPAGEYLALNKPRFVLSDDVTDDPRRTVFDLVPTHGHRFVVGRLDFESEGLILLTNDGELANQLTHPRYGHEKEYRVLVARRPDEEQLEVWRRGVVLEDGHKTSPADVRLDTTAGKGAWLRITMHEGRKRQIREICNLIGLPVVRILRVRIGSLKLGSLKPGEWRSLTPTEVRGLKEGIPAADTKTLRKPRPAPKGRPTGKPRTAPDGRTSGKPRTAPGEKTTTKPRTGPGGRTTSKPRTGPGGSTTTKPRTAPGEKTSGKPRPIQKTKKKKKT